MININNANLDGEDKENKSEFIDVKELLQKIGEEEIFFKYLGFYPDTKMHRNPFRDDKKASCNFYWNGTKFKFKDRAAKIDEDCIGIVQLRYNCSFRQALEIIAKDFKTGTLTKKSDKVNRTLALLKENNGAEIAVKQRPFNKLDLDYWNKFNIDEEILTLFNIYAADEVWINKQLKYCYKYSDPAYAYYFPTVEEFKIYYPKRTENKFRCNTSYLQGYDQLPDKGELLFITKSLKDVACLYSLGFSAVAPQSEVSFIDESILYDLVKRFDNVIIFYDNDKTGLEFAEKFSIEYNLPFIFIPQGYEKDISDFTEENGADSSLDLMLHLLNL